MIRLTNLPRWISRMSTGSLPASRARPRPAVGVALLFVMFGCAPQQVTQPSGHIAMSSAIQDALENNASGEVVEWWNLDTGDRGTVTPLRTFMSAAGLPCREYRVMAVHGDAGSEFQNAIACREVDGVWRDEG
jgi:surface antigen